MKTQKINNIGFIVLTILLQSLSSLSMKYASIYDSLKLIFLGAAFALMVTRAYTWQRVLKHNELSRVYPFNSLVQVLILVYAALLFGEEITLWHIFGLILMMCGVILLGKNK